MRLISDFKDYYDGALKQGGDQSIIFVRKIHKFEEKDLKFSFTEKFKFSINFINPSLNMPPGMFSHSEMSSVLLGCCGSFYPAVRVKYCKGLKWKDKVIEDADKIFWNFEDFDSFAKENISNYASKRYAFFREGSHQSKVRGFFNKDYSRLDEVFHYYQVPLFLFQYEKADVWHRNIILELNPKLTDIDFVKTKDPYSLFQDIQSYISGVLNSKENNMVKIADKDKISKHGFDKWSFRKKGPNSK